MKTTSRRVVIQEDPFENMEQNPFNRGSWPANWVQHPEVRGAGPAVVAYRRMITLEADTTVRMHISADERYELFLDGERIGRGSERGDRHCWFFETYDLSLSAGPHVLVARVFWLGADSVSAHAQMTVRPAFLFVAEGVAPEVWNTGFAPWEAKRLGGYEFVSPNMAWGTSAKTVLWGADYDWGHESGHGDSWQAVQVVATAFSAARTCMAPNNWMLRPAMLPAMLAQPCQTGTARHVQAINPEESGDLAVRGVDHLADEAQAWDRLLSGASSLTIPANTKRRVIVDLGNYFCAYPVVTLSRGKKATMAIRWAESLYEQGVAIPGCVFSVPKGNRDEIEGKYFTGIGDTFIHDGGQNRRYEPFWWEAGRYLEIMVAAGDEPLVVENFHLVETHYPYQFSGHYEVPSQELTDLVPLAIRVLEMCSHETYMDCPYYEQLMYVGDTRLEVLTTYTLTSDDRLPRKAILLYDESRGTMGLTQSRYPSRVPQWIAPFSLYWVGMVYDFALWRDDAAFVRARMPGVRAVLDAFAQCVNGDGLLKAVQGWNFVDWVPNWDAGMPPDADFGISGIINWHFVYTLRMAAELEDGFGEPEFAVRNRRLADRVAAATTAAFWDSKRGVYADDLAHQNFSEHAQCFAILAGDRRTRLDAPGLSQATIYFSHYLFEAARLVDRIDLLFKRLELWSYLKRMGFKTTVESPEPSRSDCHAWGAHPLYHTFATLLGIRPVGFGFRNVCIEPQLGPMAWGRGTIPHPLGSLSLALERAGEHYTGVIELPPGVNGTFLNGTQRKELRPGKNTL